MTDIFFPEALKRLMTIIETKRTLFFPSETKDCTNYLNIHSNHISSASLFGGWGEVGDGCLTKNWIYDSINL